MNISSVGPAWTQVAKPAADGDTAAAEARESAATKKAEQLNGGSAPRPPTPPVSPRTAGGVDRTA